MPGQAARFGNTAVGSPRSENTAANERSVFSVDLATRVSTASVKGHSVSATQVGVQPRTRNNNSFPASTRESHIEGFTSSLPHMVRRAVCCSFTKQLRVRCVEPPAG